MRTTAEPEHEDLDPVKLVLFNNLQLAIMPKTIYTWT